MTKPTTKKHVERLVQIQQSYFSYDDFRRLTICMLQSHSELEALECIYCALGSQTGTPLAPLLGYNDEAIFWSSNASFLEREAYCLACFNDMLPPRQIAFLAYVTERNVT